MVAPEAISVLEGRGRIRIGESDVAVRVREDVVLLSGSDATHQTLNDSKAVLRSLCFSAMIEPEVNVYLESNRLGFFAGSAPGGDREQRFLEGVLPLEACLDYWTGEQPNNK